MDALHAAAKLERRVHFNGTVARASIVFVSAGSSGYMTVGEDRNTLAIGVRKSRLEHDMRALAGGDATDEGAAVGPPLASRDSTSTQNKRQRERGE